MIMLISQSAQDNVASHRQHRIASLHKEQDNFESYGQHQIPSHLPRSTSDNITSYGQHQMDIFTSQSGPAPRQHRITSQYTTSTDFLQKKILQFYLFIYLIFFFFENLVSYQKKGGHAWPRPSFFWFDNDSGHEGPFLHNAAHVIVVNCVL